MIKKSMNNDLSLFLGDLRYKDFISSYFNSEKFIRCVPGRILDNLNISDNPGADIKKRLLRNKDYILPANFNRVRIPTKDTDVFICRTDLDPKGYTNHDLNMTYVVKIWDKKEKTEQQKIMLDKKFNDELRNNNYYRRIGLSKTERYMSGKEDDFNFLVMTYLNTTDALETMESLEEKIEWTINPSEKKKAIKKKDSFRDKMCDNIAKVQAFSAESYSTEIGEDFEKRINEDIINTYNIFFMKYRNLLDSELESKLEKKLSDIAMKVKSGSGCLISGLKSIPNSDYTDRFLRNMCVDKNEEIIPIDFGSRKQLPAQFDLAFPFIQGNDIPKQIKLKHIRTYFDAYPEYVSEYNAAVEEKLNNLEKTIFDEITRPGVYSHDKKNLFQVIIGYMENEDTLGDINPGNIEIKKQEIYKIVDKAVSMSNIIKDSDREAAADDIKYDIDEIFMFVRSLKKKDTFLPTYDEKHNIVPAEFDKFCEGLALSEAYRGLIVGSAYTHYMKDEIDEENLDYFIRMINSSMRAMDWYSEEYAGADEKSSGFKSALKEWKDLALHIKKGYIEKNGTKKNIHKVNFHVHTGATEDARRMDNIKPNTLVNMLNAAYKNGLTDIAITNHIFLHGENGETTTDPEYLREMCSLIDNIKEGSKIRIYKGIEVDWLGKEYEEDVRNHVKELSGICNGFDYILGSVHRIEGEWFLPTKDRKKVLGNIDTVEYYRRYFSLVKEAIDSKIFNYIAHPDVIRKFEHNLNAEDKKYMIEPVPFEKYSDKIEDAVKSAVDNNVGFEINTIGLKHPVSEIYPSRDFLTMYIDECYMNKKRPRLILGSDAHSTTQIDNDRLNNLHLQGLLHALSCGYDGSFMPLTMKVY